MYRDKNNINDKHSNASDSQPHNRRSGRWATQKRKQRKQKIIAVNLAIIMVIIILISIFLIKTNGSTNDNEASDNIKGTWVYNQYVQYEFNGHGNGCMCLEDTHYEYTYEINKDTLSIDFDNEAVHDCVYKFTVEGDNLTIVGGEGTTGGTYTLSKSSRE